MTATLFATFVDQGTFNWNTTLFDALPSDIVQKMHPGHRNTTLEMLLVHISGIYNLGTKDALWPVLYGTNLKPEQGRALWTEFVLSRPPVTVPGEVFEYSNTGYMLLGHILEWRLRTPWESLITSKLFIPLGMTQCGFGNPPESSVASVDNPWPHSQNSTSLTLLPYLPTSPFSDNPRALGPAGIVHCSLPSWTKFIQFHLTGDLGTTTRLLSDESFQKLHTSGKIAGPNPIELGYTFGAWFSVERSWAKGKVLNHDGSNTLNYATAWLDLEGRRAFLSTTNVGGPVAQKGTDEAIATMINGGILNVDGSCGPDHKSGDQIVL
jgi:D-alanyl-D-alanine carboxypeptidase